ncbi:MAG: hypothetical protein HRU38_25135 [Saccharospirillaceae bacterium]|nr:hypothetical protein [Saccharospirillaceae bacterium]
MHTLNIENILDKGIDDEKSLSKLERSVFVVVYLESIADAQGWDHYFTYSMNLYDELELILTNCNDQLSLAVLNDYKGHFNDLNVNFSSVAIDDFLSKANHEYFDNCSDWREEFEKCFEQRWSLISAYFLNLGISVET